MRRMADTGGGHSHKQEKRDEEDKTEKGNPISTQRVERPAGLKNPRNTGSETESCESKKTRPGSPTMVYYPG